MTYLKVCTKRQLRDSQQLKTTFDLYNQDTVQKNEPTCHTRLKNMANQVPKDRIFDARNDSTASGARIRRKVGDRSESEDGKAGVQTMVGQRKALQRRVMQNKNDLTKKGEGKGKRDRPSSLSPGPRSPCKDIQDGKGAAKGKSRKAPARLVHRSSASQDVELREQAVGLNERETVHPEKRAARDLRGQLEYTKTTERFFRIQEQLGPSLGVIQGGPPHHRNPNAPTLNCRVEIQTTRCGQKMVQEKQFWQWGKKLYRSRGTHLRNEATFFKPMMEWRVASTSTVNPDERDLFHC